MQKARCKSLKETGFTLIELLVAVAIIAVLISILLPALAQARAQAHKITCASRLGQTGLGFIGYAHESGDFLPAILYKDKYGSLVHWYFALAKYMPGGDQGRTYEVIHCPMIPLVMGSNNSSTLTIGMNALLLMPNWVLDADLLRYKKASQIDNPTNTVLAADCIAKSKGAGWTHPYTGYPLLSESMPANFYGGYGEADYRHLGVANALYVDGHVQSGKLPFSESATDGNFPAWHGKTP